MEIIFDLSFIQILQLFVGVILPVIVGLVTTKVTSSNRKAILLLSLSVVTALLSEAIASAQANEAYDLGVGLITALTTFIIGVAVQFGLWKPVGVTDKVQAIGSSRAS